MIFVLSEFWISSAAPRGQRGMVLGIYSTVLAVGFATGPALLSLIGWQGLPPFLVAAAMLGLGALPVALAGDAGAAQMEGSGLPKIGGIFVAAPAALGAALLYGALETGLEGLLPVFGLRSGFTPFWSTFQLTLYSLGNVVFPIPMGLIADRINKMKLLAFFAMVGVTGALFLPGLSDDIFVYGLTLFLWGGIVSAAYPVGLSVLAEKFHGERLGRRQRRLYHDVCARHDGGTASARTRPGPRLATWPVGRRGLVFRRLSSADPGLRAEAALKNPPQTADKT